MRSMTRIAYTVTATLPDEASAREYIAWLREGHVDEVVEHGAHTGMIVRLTEPATPIRVETRYVFSTQSLFDRYVKQFAPMLREEGLQKFPPESGVTFERCVGEIE